MVKPLRFALVGVAGYIAPRHIRAIKDVGGDLVAALDPHDSVGILDRYFPGCLYFREPERFDRWLSKHRVDYVSVCSPNYLHDAHCLMAIRNGADVICEKPLVLNSRNLDNLVKWEISTQKKVNVILQCRLHSEVIEVKKTTKADKISSIDVDYCAPRGKWYQRSWKDDVAKSGGLVTNIGIHLFDLAIWLAGPAYDLEICSITDNEASGLARLGNAKLNWRLSTQINRPQKRTFRIDGAVLDLTSGFDNLHTESYRQILENNGFGIEDIRPATQAVEAIRNAC